MTIIKFTSGDKSVDLQEFIALYNPTLKMLQEFSLYGVCANKEFTFISTKN